MNRQRDSHSEEDLRRMEVKRDMDLLWSGDRTIKETYSQISSIYADLATILGDFVSGLPEGGLNISDKYSDIGYYSLAISEYYKTKSERVAVDGSLADRINTPGWETLRVLSDLPIEIQSEIKEDLQEGSNTPHYWTAVSTLREIGKLIKEGISTITPEEKESTLFPDSPSMSDKEDYIIQDRVSVLRVLQTTKRLEREIKEIRDQVSPALRKKCGEYSHTTEIILDSLSLGM